jgi:AcrR family transcriptional regulator
MNGVDDASFEAAIANAIDFHGVTATDIADACGCPVPTVKRWYSGEAQPHPAMRAPILKMVADLVQRLVQARDPK